MPAFDPYDPDMDDALNLAHYRRMKAEKKAYNKAAKKRQREARRVESSGFWTPTKDTELRELIFRQRKTATEVAELWEICELAIKRRIKKLGMQKFYGQTLLNTKHVAAYRASLKAEKARLAEKARSNWKNTK